MRWAWGALLVFVGWAAAAPHEIDLRQNTDNSTIIYGSGGYANQGMMEFLSSMYRQISVTSYNRNGLELYYIAEGAVAGLEDFINSNTDFGVYTGTFIDQAQYDKYTKLHGGGTMGMFPYLGYILTMSYNLPNTTTTLTIDRNVLPRIYSKNISYWDDPALVALNPGLNLPHQKIRLVYQVKGTGITEVLTGALASMDPEGWAKTYGSSSFFNLSIPQKGVDVGATSHQDAAFKVLSTPYSFGYIPLPYATQYSCTNANIINKAQSVVGPDLKKIQDNFFEYDLTHIDATTLVDRGGEGDYPFIGMSYVVFQKTSGPDCNTDRLLRTVIFLAWAVEDTNAERTIFETQFLIVPTSLRRTVLAQLLVTECGGTKVIDMLDGLDIGLIVITGFMCVIAIISLILFILYREHPVIKHPSFISLFIMVIGYIFGFMSTILFILAPTDFLCSLQIWATGIGFNLVYGSLCAKSYYLSRTVSKEKDVDPQSPLTLSLSNSNGSLILVNGNDSSSDVLGVPPKYIIPANDFLRMVVLFVGFEMVFQMLWTVVDRPRELFNQCSYSSSFIVPYYVMKAVIIIVGTVFSFMIRNEKAFERDSKYNISVFAILIVIMIVFAPILLLNTQTTRAKTITTQIISIPVGALLVSSGAMITSVAPYIHSLFQKTLVSPFNPKLEKKNRCCMYLYES